MVVRLFNQVFPGCFLLVYTLYSSRTYCDEGSYCIIDPINMKIPYQYNTESYGETASSITLLHRHPNYIDGNAEFNWVFFFGLFTYTIVMLIGMANVYQFRKFCGDAPVPAHSTEEVDPTHYKFSLAQCFIVVLQSAMAARLRFSQVGVTCSGDQLNQEQLVKMKLSILKNQGALLFWLPLLQMSTCFIHFLIFCVILPLTVQKRRVGVVQESQQQLSDSQNKDDDYQKVQD